MTFFLSLSFPPFVSLPCISLFFPWSKVSHYFLNPTHTIKIKTTNKWQTTNNKPPKPIILIGQLEIKSINYIIFGKS
jgi:hypothetical protein